MAGPVKFLSKGIIATAFAPFKGNSAELLNLSIIPEYAKYYAANGFKMILINGTLGEGMAMETEERMQLAKAWSDACKQTGQELIVHVGGTNLQSVKKLAAHAQSVNANALLCLPELYYKPKSVEDLIDYLAIVGASAPKVPLIYYHSPVATGVALNMAELFQKIQNKVPSFVGVKFACTKMDELALAVKAASANDRFRIIVSNNFIIPAAVALGVDTFMPVTINIVPDIIKNIYNSSMAGDLATAQANELKLLEVYEKLLAVDKSYWPVLKAVSRRLFMPKFDIGITRPPVKNHDTSPLVSQLVSELQK